MGRRREQEQTSHVLADPSRPGAVLVRVGGTDQSYVDPVDPLHLEFDYVTRIVAGIDAWRAPGERIRALHVGGGGMTIPRYLAHTRPTSAQVVLEPDEALLDEVREAAPLPPRSGIKVRPVDGVTGVAAVADDWADLVVVDAFAGGRVPAELGEVAFFREVARVLAPGGLAVMNLTDRAPFAYARRIVAGLEASFADVCLGGETSTLRGRRFGNLVAFAGDRAPARELARRFAGGAFPYRVLDAASLVGWVAKAEPFDGDATPSPLPDRPGSRRLA